MLIQSERLAYENGRYTVPIWTLDTENYTVIHRNEQNQEDERTSFATAECIRYHIDYTMETDPQRFQKLVDNGEILTYLETLEQRVWDAVDAQTAYWESNDKEYRTALHMGDTMKIVGLKNMFLLSAKEAVYPAMVYV